MNYGMYFNSKQNFWARYIQYKVAKHIFNIIIKKNCSSVLELGPGNGVLANNLITDCRIIDYKCIDKCKSASKYIPNESLFICEFPPINFPHSEFKAVVLCHVYVRK